MNSQRDVYFSLGGMKFEYDEDKNQVNIKKHGISFRNAAKVFFDYDRIELFDEENSIDEDRYDTIGDISLGLASAGRGNVIGNVMGKTGRQSDILFVVYTERVEMSEDGRPMDVTRLISARMATGFERGLYYGKYE